MMDGQSPQSPPPEPPPIDPNIVVYPSASTGAPTQQRRAWWLRRDLIEMFVVFMIGVFPALFSSSLSFLWWGSEGARGQYAEWSTHLWLIQRSFAVSVPVLYLMWRSRLGWAFFGISRPRYVLDTALGIVIVVINYLIYYGVWYASAIAERTFSQMSGEHLNLVETIAASESWSCASPGFVVLVFFSSIANGFAEELVMRAYFIPRLEKSLHSTAAAVLITATVFGAYHLYYGIGGATMIGILGLVLGWIFVKTRRIWPVFVAHMLLDFVPAIWP